MSPHLFNLHSFYKNLPNSWPFPHWPRYIIHKYYPTSWRGKPWILIVYWDETHKNSFDTFHYIYIFFKSSEAQTHTFQQCVLDVSLQSCSANALSHLPKGAASQAESRPSRGNRPTGLRALSPYHAVLFGHWVYSLHSVDFFSISLKWLLQTVSLWVQLKVL